MLLNQIYHQPQPPPAAMALAVSIPYNQEISIASSKESSFRLQYTTGLQPLPWHSSAILQPNSFALWLQEHNTAACEGDRLILEVVIFLYPHALLIFWARGLPWTWIHMSARLCSSPLQLTIYGVMYAIPITSYPLLVQPNWSTLEPLLQVTNCSTWSHGLVVANQARSCLRPLIWFLDRRHLQNFPKGSNRWLPIFTTGLPSLWISRYQQVNLIVMAPYPIWSCPHLWLIIPCEPWYEICTCSRWRRLKPIGITLLATSMPWHSWFDGSLWYVLFQICVNGNGWLNLGLA